MSTPQQVVIVCDWGSGLHLSAAALDMLAERGFTGDPDDLPRDDPRLVEVVDTLGDQAGGLSGILIGRPRQRLAVVEVPAGVDWIVQEVDGLEWVAERHRRWDADGEISGEDSAVPPARVRRSTYSG